MNNNLVKRERKKNPEMNYLVLRKVCSNQYKKLKTKREEEKGKRHVSKDDKKIVKREILILLVIYTKKIGRNVD